MTLRAADPCSMVGAIVMPATAGIVCSQLSCSRAAVAIASARPSRSTAPSPSSASSMRAHGRVVGRLGHALADAAQDLPEQGYGVVADRRRGGVAGLAEGVDAHRAGALLADRDLDHEPAVAEPEGQAAALVERVVGGDVRALGHEPVHADLGRPVLLVGHDHEQQVAGAAPAAARQRRHGDGAGRDLVLHVDRPAAPQEAVVVDHGTERRVDPVAGVGRHHVAVPDEGERRSAAGARDPGDEVGATRVARDQLDLDPGALQVGGEHLGHRGLVAVRGVDPDDLGGEPDRLVVTDVSRRQGRFRWQRCSHGGTLLPESGSARSSRGLGVAPSVDVSWVTLGPQSAGSATTPRLFLAHSAPDLSNRRWTG